MKRTSAAAANKRPYKRQATPATKAVVAAEVKKQMSRTGDYKQFAGFFSSVADATGTIGNLLGTLSRGDAAVNQFDGASINIEGFKFRYQAVASDTTNMLRIIVFQWFPSSTPAVSSVLASTFVGTSQVPLAYRNWSNRHNYRVLFDDIIQLQNDTGVTGGNGKALVREHYIKGKKLRKVNFDATASTVTSNALYYLVVSDSTAVTHPGFFWSIDGVFTD